MFSFFSFHQRSGSVLGERREEGEICVSTADTFIRLINGASGGERKSGQQQSHLHSKPSFSWLT